MNWNKLKWIAILSMTMDHIALALPLPSISILGLPLYHLLRLFGRAAFPIFAFGISQGCIFTHNLKRYLSRLLLFAFISEIPFQLALRYGRLAFGFNNVFFTLFAGACCCGIIKFFSNKKNSWVAVFPIIAIILFCEINHTDYGGFGVLFILAPYIFKNNKSHQIISLSIIVAVFYIFVSQFSGFSYPQFTWMTLTGNIRLVLQDLIGASLGIFLLILYNGQQGSSHGKWLFYLYYPSHLLVLYAISIILKLN